MTDFEIREKRLSVHSRSIRDANMLGKKDFNGFNILPDESLTLEGKLTNKLSALFYKKNG